MNNKTSLLFLVFVAAIAGCRSKPSSESPDVNRAAAVVPSSAPVSVEAAYASVGRTDIKWNPALSSASPAIKQYVSSASELIDQCVMIRAQCLAHFSQGNFAENDLKKWDDSTLIFKFLSPPAEMKAHHDALVSALDHERKFLSDWSEKKNSFSYATSSSWPNQDDLKQASSDLKSAGQNMLQALPSEPEPNRSAIVNMHDALDFLSSKSAA